MKKAIRNQNHETIKHEAEIEVEFNKKPKNSYIVVIDVDVQIYVRIMRDGRLKIKWQCCQVK